MYASIASRNALVNALAPSSLKPLIHGRADLGGKYRGRLLDNTEEFYYAVGGDPSITQGFTIILHYVVF